MNSQKIIKEHKDIYVDFISGKDVIRSISHTISLAGGTNCVLGGTVIEQKIPFRCYVGIRKTNSGGITFGRYLRFNSKKDIFEEAGLGEYDTPGQTFLDTLNDLFPETNCEISFLNELRNRTVDAVSFLSVLCLSILKDPSVEYDNFDVRGLYDSAAFRKLIRVSERARLNYNEHTKGLSSMAVIFAGASRNRGPIAHKASVKIPLVGKEEAEKFIQSEERAMCGFEISSITQSRNETIPFEIFIISPEKTIWNGFWYGELLKTIHGGISGANDFSFATGGNSNRQRAVFDFEQMFVAVVNACELSTLNALSKLKDFSDAQTTEGELIWSIEKTNSISAFLTGKSNFESHQTRDEIIEAVKSAFHKCGKDTYVVYKNGASSDLNYVVMYPKSTSKSDSTVLQNIISDALGNSGTIIYSSFCDGTDASGLSQLTVNEILLTSNQKNIIETYSLTTKEKRYHNSRFDEYSMEFNGVLLDLDYGKIYCEGIQANSKEIPSQQFTVDFLSKIYDQGFVTNKSLPHSAYSISKNEFSSKILGPFKRYVMNKSGIEIEWILEGSETNFNVGLKGVEGGHISLAKRVSGE